jgi:dienelactone hydrolase
VGFEESKDALAWINYIVKEFKVKSVVLHGICIGAAGAMLAATSDSCPAEVKAVVTDGMFVNFAESVKNHLIERKKPVFIMLDLIDAQMIKYTGHSMKVGPIDYVGRLNKPLLMLHSKEDIYSTPEKAVELFNKAGSAQKEIVWFPKGEHSMLRYTDTQRYDNAIKAFLEKI